MRAPTSRNGFPVSPMLRSAPPPVPTPRQLWRANREAAPSVSIVRLGETVRGHAGASRATVARRWLTVWSSKRAATVTGGGRHVWQSVVFSQVWSISSTPSSLA
jgi:hypothetical protein